MPVTLLPAGRVALIVTLMTLFACSPQADFPEPTATIQTTSRTTQPPTPEELAVEAAMTAYNGMRQVTDAARRDPGVKDWEPEIRQFAGDLSHSWWSSRSGTTQPWGLGKWGRRRRRRKALRWIWPRWRARL